MSDEGSPSGSGEAPDRLAWSIVATILCCWPVGIPAIVYSAKAMAANAAGEFSTAWSYSNKAKVWAWIVFWSGVATLAIGFVFDVFIWD